MNIHTYIDSIIEKESPSNFLAKSCPYSQPEGLLLECLRVGPLGGIGHSGYSYWQKPREVTSGHVQHCHPNSHFTFDLLTPAISGFNRVSTVISGLPRLLCYRTEGARINPIATNRLFRPGTSLFDEGDCVLPPISKGDAYAVLKLWRKPYANITTSLDDDLVMNELAGELLRGWWHALRTKNGWRVFADDIDNLFHLKLKFPRY